MKTINIHYLIGLKMDSFNLTLNCTPKKCLNQGMNKFFTVLPDEISLHGEWEVALSEISFINNVYNIENEETIRIITPNKIYSLQDSIEPGFYSVDSLIEIINSIVSKHFDELRKQIPRFPLPIWVKINDPATSIGKLFGFEHPKDNLKGKPEWSFKQYPKFKFIEKELILESGINTKNHLYFIQPSENLCKFLGFDAKEILVDALDKYNRFDESWSNDLKEIYVENEKNIQQKYKYKTFEKLNSLYVCSDIGKPIVFGENYQPILRYINFDSFKTNELIHLKYKKPYYIKLRKNPFERIEISLFRKLHYLSDVDAYETPYWMKYSDVKIVLQFRKISNKQTLYEKEILKRFKKPHDSRFDIISFDPNNPPATYRINP